MLLDFLFNEKSFSSRIVFSLLFDQNDFDEEDFPCDAGTDGLEFVNEISAQALNSS